MIMCSETVTLKVSFLNIPSRGSVCLREKLLLSDNRLNAYTSTLAEEMIMFC